ncbi:MAG: hypothetical protein MZV70_76080 [Desulfobacterales bacterium]|nr:hypothetical protein [Desulfobacterales bacterium]
MAVAIEALKQQRQDPLGLHSGLRPALRGRHREHPRPQGLRRHPQPGAHDRAAYLAEVEEELRPLSGGHHRHLRRVRQPPPGLGRAAHDRRLPRDGPHGARRRAAQRRWLLRHPGRRLQLRCSGKERAGADSGLVRITPRPTEVWPENRSRRLI